MSRESRTARLTILIDPRKKVVFEALCADVDLTTSQVLRKLIRDYIEYRTGKAWEPDKAAVRSGTGRRAAKNRRS